MAKRKPGKYDHLLAKYPKMPPQDLKHQEKINHRKVTLRECPRCKTVGFLLDENGDLTEDPCSTCNGTGEWELTAPRLAELYINARADAMMVAIAASASNVELEALTQLLIDSQQNPDPEWGAFGASDRSLKLTNGDVLRVQPTLRGNITTKNRELFRKWCYANGLLDHMELPEKKTQDLIKARLLTGELDPEGVDIYTTAGLVYVPLKTEVASDTPPPTDDETLF